MAELVGLADAIEALRSELTTAMDAGRGERMQFSLEPIELTVQAVVTKEGEGRIGWSVLGVGGSYESAQTQSVTLRLMPLWRQKTGALTADFSIAASAPAGDAVGPHD